MLRAFTVNMVGYSHRIQYLSEEQKNEYTHTQIAESNVFEAIESCGEKKSHVCVCGFADKYHEEFQCT